MTILVFDIETVPDIDSGKKLYDLHDLPDAEIAEAMLLARREKTGSDFLPCHLQKIVAISVVMETQGKFRVWSIGDIDIDEANIIQRFFDGIDRYSPTLVSWNGGGFDLPVLHYRSLLHSIDASRYWESGEHDQAFRWNNYTSRYHKRHTDLMDVLAAYQARANAPLDEIATMMGFPGKMGMSGAHVWQAYQDGNIAGIRNYCETDVLNTYLVYLRYLLISGQITQPQILEQQQRLRDYLREENKAHFTEFLNHWE